MEKSTGRYTGESLREFAAAVLQRLEVPAEDAAVVADSLVRADLEGHVGHGISRLPIYAKRLREGRITAWPQMKFDRAGAVLRVDGGNGLGQAVSVRALEAALPITRELGVAAVFIRGSNHFGTAAYLCQKAAKHELASIIMTNSPPGIPPWGGKAAFFGTNPVAFGLPAGPDRPPIVADLSSSVAARGKIILADKLGQTIPEGWAIDREGNPTTDAAQALQGAVLPVGGAKGYALALAVEAFSGILTQAAFGPHVANLYKDGDGPANVGHVLLLFRLENWLGMEGYYESIRQFIEEIKEVPRISGAGEILIPGERRHRAWTDNLQDGVAVAANVRLELEELAREAGVSFPASVGGQQPEHGGAL
ncbi:MAG: malate dehydrogenase [Paenibacillaceae bacterium]|nr:malate dehydrogenase [Paenibacillaceae bacterium]